MLPSHNERNIKCYYFKRYYLMNQSPIIVSKNIGTAAKIAEENKQDIYLKILAIKLLKNINKIVNRQRKFSSKALVEYAKNNFESRKIVKMYKSFFRNI